MHHWWCQAVKIFKNVAHLFVREKFRAAQRKGQVRKLPAATSLRKAICHTAAQPESVTVRPKFGCVDPEAWGHYQTALYAFFALCKTKRDFTFTITTSSHCKLTIAFSLSQAESLVKRNANPVSRN